MLCCSVVTKTVHKIDLEVSGPAPLEELDQVHELVRQINLHYARLPVLTPDEIIQRGLLLTKGDPSDVEIAETFLFFRMRELASGDLGSWSVEGIAAKTNLMRNWWGEIQSDRDRFRVRLDELIQDRHGAREKHLDGDIDLLQKDLAIIPYLGDSATVVFRYFPKSIVAAFTFVLSLIYKEDFKKLDRVQMCAWEPCSAYFLRRASRKGGRPQQYCSPECQKMPDRKKAVIRQAKPEQRKKQRNRKRKSREEGRK